MQLLDLQALGFPLPHEMGESPARRGHSPLSSPSPKDAGTWYMILLTQESMILAKVSSRLSLLNSSFCMHSSGSVSKDKGRIPGPPLEIQGPSPASRQAAWE